MNIGIYLIRDVDVMHDPLILGWSDQGHSETAEDHNFQTPVHRFPTCYSPVLHAPIPPQMLHHNVQTIRRLHHMSIPLKVLLLGYLHMASPFLGYHHHVLFLEPPLSPCSKCS